mgnify:CR=1 FL=1
MKIGELAKMTRCQVVTIRYYESAGLLPPPRRSEANYRVYDAVHVERLAFIRNCRALDMTDDCGGVNELIDQHIEHVASKIAALQALKKQLSALRKSCTEGREAAYCEILQRLTITGSRALSPNHKAACGTTRPCKAG